MNTRSQQQNKDIEEIKEQVLTKDLGKLRGRAPTLDQVDDDDLVNQNSSRESSVTSDVRIQRIGQEAMNL